MDVLTCEPATQAVIAMDNYGDGDTAPQIVSIPFE
jgi:hypothetical protein